MFLPYLYFIKYMIKIYILFSQAKSTEDFVHNILTDRFTGYLSQIIGSIPYIYCQKIHRHHFLLCRHCFINARQGLVYKAFMLTLVSRISLFMLTSPDTNISTRASPNSFNPCLLSGMFSNIFYPLTAFLFLNFIFIHKINLIYEYNELFIHKF